MNKLPLLAALILTFAHQPARAGALDFGITDEECRGAIRAQADRQYRNHQYAEEQYSWSKSRSDERMKDQAEIRDDSVRIADEMPRPCGEGLNEIEGHTIERL